MKKLLLALAAGAMALTATAALAQDKLTLQLKWVTQAQFAGYIVAKAKGFYTEENLDVTIAPGDIVVGDVDGVVVVPRAQALAVLSTAMTKITGERRMRADLEAGMPLAEAFRKHGLL